MRRHVRSLQVVLADGQLMEVGREPLADGTRRDANPRKRELVNRLVTLLTKHADLIRQNQPKSPLNRCGYQLIDVLGDGHLDLARLLVGSEGTLALITEATLATRPLPRHRGVALLLFDSLEKASRSVLEILPWQPTACDLVDRRHLSLARETEVRFDLLIPRETEAVLLVEQEGETPLEVRDRLHRLVDDVWHQKHMAFGARQAFDPDEMELFWQLVNKVEPAMYPMKGPSRPVPVVEDMAVPPEVLPDFLVRMQNVLKRHQVTASLFCHAGQGQLHIQPFLDLTHADDVQQMRRLAEELYQEVFDVGGTISGEHACGLSRTPFIPRQVGELYDVFRQVKEIFDSAGTLNPGKIVGNDPDLMTRNLRPAMNNPSPEATSPEATSPAPGAEAPGLRDLTELQLNWDPSRVTAAVAACNRCGECRIQSPGVRMCPIFRFAPAEESSPRAKANLIAGVLSGRMELSSLTSDEFKAVADLCVHCHMCRLECPARVDVPRLACESKGAYVAANGLRLADWLMTRLDVLCAGQHDRSRRQLGPRQSTDAVVDGEDVGDCPRPQASPGGVAELYSPCGPPPSYPTHAPQRPQSPLLRGHLRQLSRSPTGHGLGGGAGTQRRGRLRPSSAEAGRHAFDRLRSFGSRPPTGPPQRRPAGGIDPARISRRGHRAVRRTVPGARISRAGR